MKYLNPFIIPFVIPITHSQVSYTYNRRYSTVEVNILVNCVRRNEVKIEKVYLQVVFIDL